MTTPVAEVQTFARALYDEVVSVAIQNAISQLEAAQPKLTDLTEADDIPKKIKAALPRSASTEVRNFLGVLAQHDALDQLPDIIRALQNFSYADTHRTPAEVVSAMPLSDDQQQRIIAELHQRYGQMLDVHFREDASLIGGLIIRVGDQVLDTSLRARLGAIQRGMLSN